ncbi:MAG: apolipoprotein N-acyltransferase [Endomicrobiales bacterium]
MPRLPGKAAPIFLSVLSGTLVFLSFPDPGLSFLAWAAFIPLLLALPGRSAKDAFFYGLLTGLAANCGVLYWIFPMIRFNTGSLLQACVCLLLLAGYLALYFGAWALALRSAGRRTSSVLLYSLFAAALWVALEYARTHFLTGFPWALLGYSQWRFIPLIQISEFTGVYGVSFLIIFVNVLAARIFTTQRYSALIPVLPALALIVLWGYSARTEYAAPHGAKTTIAVIQGNIDQYKKWDEAYEQEIIDTYSSLVREASALRPALVVWPETAVPGFLPVDRRLYSWVSGLARETGAYQLAGTPFNDGGRDSYNSVLLFGPQGGLAGWHKKTHLIPFGEYVPLRKILEPFFGILNALGDFNRGDEHNVLAAGSLKWGPSICSENFFGGIVRRFVRNGADILVNQTNDAWFFRTSAPAQHFIMNVFRAVENRRTVVVSGNTGISGIVAPSGEVGRQLPIFTRGYFTAEVAPCRTVTFYTRWGDVFALLCVTAAAAAFFAFLRAGKSGRRTPDAPTGAPIA